MTEPGDPDLEMARSVVVITTGAGNFQDWTFLAQWLAATVVAGVDLLALVGELGDAAAAPLEHGGEGGGERCGLAPGCLGPGTQAAMKAAAGLAGDGPIAAEGAEPAELAGRALLLVLCPGVAAPSPAPCHPSAPPIRCCATGLHGNIHRRDLGRQVIWS